MTHEFKEILNAYSKAKEISKNTVLATLVSVNGSSYRKEGVRMLIHENQQILGAVSGGCVEKEVVIQSLSVFKTGKSKLISYDGRYRLGCEGTLLILLELLEIEEGVLDEIQSCFKHRKAFDVVSYYSNKDNNQGQSFVVVHQKEYSLSSNTSTKHSSFFSQKMNPIFQLYVVGVEHDANSLCRQASFLGWDVIVVNLSKGFKNINYFLGASKMINIQGDDLEEMMIDNQTAIVLMNHNYAKDFTFLQALKNKPHPLYIGVLGAKKRKEQLLNALVENDVDVSELFLNLIHGPTGLDIGSVTPEEIAVSIVSEIILKSRAI